MSVKTGTYIQIIAMPKISKVVKTVSFTLSPRKITGPESPINPRITVVAISLSEGLPTIAELCLNKISKNPITKKVKKPI